MRSFFFIIFIIVILFFIVLQLGFLLEESLVQGVKKLIGELSGEDSEVKG